MAFLAPFTLFGWDIIGFLQKKKKSPTVLNELSFLQSAKSLASDVLDEKEISEQGELTKLVATRIAQQEIIAISKKALPQDTITTLVKAAAFPNTLPTRTSIGDIEDILEIPQSMVDIFNP